MRVLPRLFLVWLVYLYQPATAFTRGSIIVLGGRKTTPTFRNHVPLLLSGQTTTTTAEEEEVPEPPLLTEEEEEESTKLHFTKRPGSKRQRFFKALPGRNNNNNTIASKSLDRIILSTGIPAMINLAIVPITNAVDTFWVGRMGLPLALAGQAAANQAFFTIFFLVAYLPTITAPLVAAAVGSGNQQEAQERVCESLFLSNLLGGIGTILLVAAPQTALRMMLPSDAPAMTYAAPYLRIRALSMIPALVSATGSAAFRGMLDTVTPLKVGVVSNLVNLVLDPLMIFYTPMRVMGAAVATAVAELFSGVTYLRLLIKRQVARLSLLLSPPPLKDVFPLLQGGLSMLGRQLAINVALVAAARSVQRMDPTGVSAAAYGIVMQLYSVGIVIHIAMQGTAAALVPSTLARTGKADARRMADRIFGWCTIIGMILAAAQFLAVPLIVPTFSTVEAVQKAVRVPALLASVLHLINGPVFAGEGVMLGLASYRDLMIFTAGGAATLIGCLASPLGRTLEGIFASLMVFNGLQAVLVTLHYLKWGPLAIRKEYNTKEDQRIGE